MPEPALADFNQFLLQNIPSVGFMQLQLLTCNDHTLTASAPAKPNLNDKQTIFGGSSSALMVVCGWSLIKYKLEQRGLNHDVVIADAHTRWLKAQTDDLLITAHSEISWLDIITDLHDKQRPKLSVQTQVKNKENQLCTTTTAIYVILDSGKMLS
ncbi:MAG: YiiD C-terminal domain-containing protein [Marinicella pacifica]